MKEASGPAPVHLREAVAADGPAIAELHAMSWASAYRGMMADDFLDGPVRENRRAVWEARFAGEADPDRVVVLAERSGEPLAGFCCILAGSDPVYGSLIDNLHVRPGATRLRLGRTLLRCTTERVAAGRHSDRPMHILVLDANARAIGAYEGWGGRLVERFASRERDGLEHLVRRYAWESPAALLEHLDRAPA